MNKPRSFAAFTDGHEEDIFYFEIKGPNTVLFATESGIYLYQKRNMPDGLNGLHQSNYFFKILTDIENNVPISISHTFHATNNIKSIVIDERIPYEYKLSSLDDDGHCCGTIYALPDATEDDIHKAILKDLLIEYRKEGEIDDTYEWE